jgi:DNA-binding transcriptional MerR regulator
MAQVGLSEAAKLTGKSQSTIHRAAETGKLSAGKNENGDRVFDVAELERVYGLKAPDEDTDDRRNDADESPRQETQIALLEMELQQARDRLADRDERVAELKALVEDARRDRDHWREQANKLLITDQRNGGAIAQAPAQTSAESSEKRGWLRKLVGA